EAEPADARAQVLELGDLDLNASPRRAGVAQEHIEDHRLSITDRDAGHVLEVARLRGAQLGVEHQHAGLAVACMVGDLDGCTAAEVGLGIGPHASQRLVPDHLITLGLDQREDLGELRLALGRLDPIADADHVALILLFGAVFLSLAGVATGPVLDHAFELTLVGEGDVLVFFDWLRMEFHTTPERTASLAPHGAVLVRSPDSPADPPARACARAKRRKIDPKVLRRPKSWPVRDQGCWTTGG